ncbi:MAG TPA: hypothetical protein VGM39_25235 [Kofleriaceae bacterium]|jgi:hypothetical protein
MGRLDRFKKLERARPDAPSGDHEHEAKDSGRFGRIEARKDPPAPAAPDPFAPPPVPDASFEVEPEDAAARRHKAEREEHATHELALEAQRRAEIAMQEEARQTALTRGMSNGLTWWNGLAPTRRTQLAIGTVAVLALAALRFLLV